MQYQISNIKYQIYCTQIKIHLSGCLHSPSWAAVQRQRAANLLQVFVSKNPFQSREPPDLSRPFSLDQGHIEIVLQLMIHLCPWVSIQKLRAASTPWNWWSQLLFEKDSKCFLFDCELPMTDGESPDRSWDHENDRIQTFFYLLFLICFVRSKSDNCLAASVFNDKARQIGQPTP